MFFAPFLALHSAAEVSVARVNKPSIKAGGSPGHIHRGSTTGCATRLAGWAFIPLLCPPLRYGLY